MAEWECSDCGTRVSKATRPALCPACGALALRAAAPKLPSVIARVPARVVAPPTPPPIPPVPARTPPIPLAAAAVPARSASPRLGLLLFLAILFAGGVIFWMASRTSLEFQFKENGETQSPARFQVAWRGQPYHSRAFTWPGGGTYKIDSDEFEPVEGQVAAVFGQTTVIPVAVDRGRGSVRVTTDPPGAAVTQYGRMFGKTPILLRDLPTGIARLALGRPDYERTTVLDVIKRNETIDVFRRLNPLYGVHNLSTPWFQMQSWGDFRIWGGNTVDLPYGRGIEIQLAYVGVQRHEITLGFRIKSQQGTPEVLLYARENVIGSWLNPREQVSERLYIADDRGGKFYTTSGFEGGRQRRFNDKANAVMIPAQGPIVVACRFPMITRGATKIKFVSPNPDHAGHQGDWWWDNIPIFNSSEDSE